LSGWKEWGIGEVVEAGEFQSFVQDQTVQKYADAAARGSALGTAVAEGMVSYLSDTDSVEYYDGAAWAPIAVDAAWVTSGTAGQILESNGTADPAWVDAETTLVAGTQGFTALSNGTAGLTYQPVSHNYVINGAFDVWQRGTSFTNPATNDFLADRWLVVYDGSGATRTLSRQAFTPADLNATGFGEGQFFIRYAQTAGTGGTFNQLRTRVEDVRTLAGQTATISFWAKAAAEVTTPAASGILQNFGSGGSSSITQAFGSTITIGTTWQRFSITATIPSISGKTIGAGNYLEIILRLPLNNTTFTIDIWGVQLEAGSVATPFKRHAPSLQGELAACQRYYQFASTENITYATGQTNSDTNARMVISSPPMRALPSMTLNNPLLRVNGTSYSALTFTIGEMGAFGFNVQANLTSGSWSNLHACALRSGPVTLNAEL
jgi:hypothetical protein